MSASDKDSLRSRATTGMCYAVIGGAVCMTALLLIRSGVSTIPYRDGIRIPLEMVAGIAGIVVFMGFLQLVIAYILKARRRQ